LKALYLDNEDHIIHYLVAAVPGGIAFTSEVAPGPCFRLTYLRKSEALVSVRFEIAPPNKPEAYATYLEAVTIKGSELSFALTCCKTGSRSGARFAARESLQA
jgi:hypothetical protein